MRIGGIFFLAWFLSVGIAVATPNWNTRISPSTNDLRGITFNYRQFVAVGRLNTVLTSADGREWTSRLTGTPDFHSVTAGRGWFVAGGGEGWLIGSSRDGIHWTTVVSTIGQDRLLGFSYGNGLFVGVGSGFHDNGSLIVSAAIPTDFDLAKSFRPTTNALLAVTYALGLFVAVGEQGAIATSPDGASWTICESPTHEVLRAVVFHQTRFIAAGDHGIVLDSEDAMSWTLSAPAPFDVFALASSGDELVAVGSYGSAGRLHVSSDGLSWPGKSLEFTQPLRAVAHGLGSFVAVGDSGLIIQSDDLANYWSKSTSGSWEEMHWSLGKLPSFQQPAVVMMNPGWKALAVDTNTTAGYPDSLAIRKLVVSAPEGSLNQLLLNYAGLNVPLSVAADLVLGPNASLAAHYSRLLAGNMLLNGLAEFSAATVGDFGTVVVGEGRAGEMHISDSSIRVGAITLGGGAPGILNQSGGALHVETNLTINGQSIYNLTNGLLEVGTVSLGKESRPGWTGRFTAWGGSTSVTGSVRMGTSPLFAADARGEFALVAGSLQTPIVTFGNGIFTQLGGTSQIQNLKMPGPDGFGWADYALADGTLISELVVIGANPLGYFVQSGGTHKNTEGIRIHGRAIPEHEAWGYYRLLGGRLCSPQLQVLGGDFSQETGTNETTELMLDLTGTFLLRGGTLTSSNSSIRSSGAIHRQMLSSFVHSNGNHTVLSRLSVDGRYRIEAGSLNASELQIAPDGELHLKGGSVDVLGKFSMDNGSCLVQGQNYRLGKLLILRTGALSRFHDGPQVCSFDFQTSPAMVHFLDSHELSAEWSGFLALKNWRGSIDGGGVHQVCVGMSAQGLDRAQLSRIIFVNPGGVLSGSYPARILATGELVPGERPILQMQATPGGLKLSWTGDYQLFGSSNAQGPFSPLSGVTNPYSVSFIAPQAFFQLRSP